MQNIVTNYSEVPLARDSEADSGRTKGIFMSYTLPRKFRKRNYSKREEALDTEIAVSNCRRVGVRLFNISNIEIGLCIDIYTICQLLHNFLETSDSQKKMVRNLPLLKDVLSVEEHVLGKKVGIMSGHSTSLIFESCIHVPSIHFSRALWKKHVAIFFCCALTKAKRERLVASLDAAELASPLSLSLSPPPLISTAFTASLSLTQPEQRETRTLHFPVSIGSITLLSPFYFLQFLGVCFSMGQDVILEIPKSKSRKKEKADKRYGYQLKSSDGEISDLRLDRIPNFHCRSMPSRVRNPESELDNPVFKRGSVYQCSNEVFRMRKVAEGRRKVDFNLDRKDSFVSFDIVDTSCQPSTSEGSGRKSVLAPKPGMDSREFLDLTFQDQPDNQSRPDSSRRDACLLKCDEDLIEISIDEEPQQNGSDVGFERDPEPDMVSILARSFSTKIRSVDNSNMKPPRSSTLKRMLDPMKRSKSMKHPPLPESETVRRTGHSWKSLLHDLSKVNMDSQNQISAPGLLSPAHLRATLKLDLKCGSPGFTFVVSDPVEFLSAKNWKTDNALNWVYTFHENSTKRVSMKEKPVGGNATPIVGQMHVSSYLCSEKGENGNSCNSAVTEFLLYDIAQARRNSSTTVEDGLSFNLDSSACYPHSQAKLHTQLETAAIVVQIPFGQSEREHEKGDLPRVRVVTPIGTHGLPGPDEAGPTGLLDRWRYGGRCECGGWDMGCPITVLDNNFDEHWVELGTSENKQPFVLHLQGSKDKVPSISILPDGIGQFVVDFHAQLSTLQAFSICVALLHCSEAVSPGSHEKSKHKLYSKSLRLLLEEEVRHLIEAVSGEDKKKLKNSNTTVEQIAQSFTPDPPNSPMGRV
ncbi:hypothetical protein FCM35_KLT14465 [Carex littledalei]|uniref:Uncharacterized protein n=1 Tax=Carex littledalei TaxID=544730 RepID=A0A833QLX6_9POAL|nr:hypothetical protein FCM35_KLT14465 [Carex littledalei]